ncbi:hypothetical protein ACFVXW_00375 [Streptomyces sp. NPDC058251]|uniref:hypothetical protein n=1 Tax=Streptomyces sp. NPDC058251 TaxID=3346404 RepID=UPI0036E6DDC7
MRVDLRYLRVASMAQFWVKALLDDDQSMQVTAITAFREPWVTMEPEEGKSEDKIRTGLAEKLRDYLTDNEDRVLGCVAPTR